MNNSIGTTGKVLIGVGVGGLLLWGLASALGGDSGSSSSSGGSGSGGSGSGSGGSGGSLTLEQLAAQLRESYLKVSTCDIGWKDGEASRTGLQSHVTDFFAPAVARARSFGATTVDAITSSIAQLIVPGCPQPPPILSPFAIDEGLAGQLPTIQQQQFNYARIADGSQFYLAVRSTVSTLLAAG